MSQHIAPTYGNFVDLNRAEGRILTLTIESALTAQRLGIPYQDPLASINPRGIALYKVSGVNSWTDWVNYLAKSVTIPLQDLTLSRFGGMTDPNGYPILYGNLRLLSSGEACYQCGGVPEPYPILFFYDGMLADALLRGYRQVGCADCRTAAINMVAGVKQHYNQTGKSLPYLSHAAPSGIRFKGTSYDQILNNFWSRPLLEIYEYTGDSQTKQIALSLLDGSTDDSSNWTWSFKQAQQLGSASESQSAQALLAGLSAGGGGTPPPPTPAPTVTLSASPTSITSGGSSTLTWTSTNATSCSASGAWTGSKSTSGSQVVTPTVTSTYSLTCTGSGGSASQSTTVTVTTTPPPTTAKFKAGDRVQTTDNLNVRASAGADSLLLGTQPTGSLGTVVTGPTVTPLYTWWNIDFDNAPDGWVIENYLVLSTATPPPSTTPPPTLYPPVQSNVCPAYNQPTYGAPVRTFYIDAQNGNDSNGGLRMSLAWKTLGKANSSAQPGDLFLLSGTFTGQYIKPITSGTNTNRIVYRSAPNQKAHITVGQYDTLVWLDGLSNVVVENIELSAAVSPVLLRNGANNNWLRNIYLHDAGGVIISNSDGNRVEDSDFYQIGSLSGNNVDAVFIQNGADNNTIVKNRISQSGHSGITVSYQQVSEVNSSSNTIARNLVNNRWAGGIIINGKAVSTLVECNTIWESGTDPASVAGTRTGIQIMGTGGVFRHNVVSGVYSDGIDLQGYTFAGFTQNSTNNQIYHNTVYNSGDAALAFVQRDSGIVQNNSIENNIFWIAKGADGGNGQRYQIEANLYNVNTGNVWPSGSSNGNIVRYNIFPSSANFMVIIRNATNGNNIYYNSVTDAENIFSGWIQNNRTDPLLTSSTNFNLQSGSPAIDSGRVISGVIYNGAAPDRGAFESTLSSPPPGAPTVSITASPTSITSGGSSTLSWSSTNASSCSAGGAWTGS